MHLSMEGSVHSSATVTKWCYLTWEKCTLDSLWLQKHTSLSSAFSHYLPPLQILTSLPFYPLPCCLYPKLMENMIKLLKNLLVLYFGSIRNARIRIITISTSNNAGSSNCRQKGQLSPPGRRQHSLVIILFSFVMTLSCEVFWRGQSWLSFKLTSGL